MHLKQEFEIQKRLLHIFLLYLEARFFAWKLNFWGIVFILLLILLTLWLLTPNSIHRNNETLKAHLVLFISNILKCVFFHFFLVIGFLCGNENVFALIDVIVLYIGIVKIGRVSVAYYLYEMWRIRNVFGTAFLFILHI